MQRTIIALWLSAYLALCTSAGAFPLAADYKGQPVQNAPDPAIVVVKQPHGQTHHYLYSSTGPLNDNDRDPAGKLNVHLMPTFHSTDLVKWEYAETFLRRARNGSASPT